MDPQTTIWLEISHHAAFRVGGWAYVRRAGDGSLAGLAGGARRIDAERTGLSALVAALKDCRGPVQVRTVSPLLAAMPGRIAAAQAGEDAPEQNLDLWAQVLTAIAATQAQVVPAASDDRTTAFAAAWAELGRDRAKDKGDFASAIPKPNLVKSGAS